MADNESPEGIAIIYKLLVKVAEFPGESPHNLGNVYLWGQKLHSLHEIMSSYFDEEYTREYQIARNQLMAISRKYPSDAYVFQAYDLLYSWMGSLSRLYARLGLLIPQNYTYVEGGEEGL